MLLVSLDLGVKVDGLLVVEVVAPLMHQTLMIEVDMVVEEDQTQNLMQVVVMELLVMVMNVKLQELLTPEVVVVVEEIPTQELVMVVLE
tara:strand:+ start:151 stop:417 length:267 start_codon:yes stop_codon:yes gene_type:complete